MSVPDESFSGGGCAHKFDLRLLIEDHLMGLDGRREDIALGVSDLEDVGAWRLGNGSVLAQSIDVIAALPFPLEIFGEICVAHCLSDVHAKGIRPRTALMALFCRQSPYDRAAISDLFSGISRALERADVAWLGGHTVASDRLYCGVSVTGIGYERDLIRKSGARHGDLLVLTKPLGTGVVAAAVKHGALPEGPPTVLESMRQFNDMLLDPEARKCVHAATDVTGAGLAGALHDVAIQSAVRLQVDSSAVPFFESVRALTSRFVEDSSLLNRDYCAGQIVFGEDVDTEVELGVFGPETSGGLLLAVREDRIDELRAIARGRRGEDPMIIGSVSASSGDPGVVVS